MGIMVYSLLWEMQDLYHQPYGDYLSDLEISLVRGRGQEFVRCLCVLPSSFSMSVLSGHMFYQKSAGWFLLAALIAGPSVLDALLSGQYKMLQGDGCQERAKTSQVRLQLRFHAYPRRAT